jgi:hypothetical protein
MHPCYKNYSTNQTFSQTLIQTLNDTKTIIAYNSHNIFMTIHNKCLFKSHFEQQITHKQSKQSLIFDNSPTPMRIINIKNNIFAK